ncbi:M3 family metallopeptidase [Corynebacterium caspium]|uniref:M3 family metallopeptidase n=1 Tax=Corynebacterium caspium TaxID=234828 RepID=UPI00058CB7C3|nr:M3 family metallopeptidase [Corynebacterium caspium]
MNSSYAYLLEPSSLPYQLPDFAAIKVEDFLPAFYRAMELHDFEISEIANNPELATWENTVEALERSGAELNRVSAIFFNLQGTDSSPELDAIAKEIVPKLAAHNDAMHHNSQLFQRIQDAPAPADEESQRLKDLLVRRFKRHGAQLSSADKAILSDINQRLSALGEEFGTNLLADTRRLAPSFSDAAQLAGLPPALIAAAKTESSYVLPLELPTIQAVQSQLQDPESRRRVYEASQLRGAESNAEVVLEMVKLRAQRAVMLGYPTHADYVIAEETAAAVPAVSRLLNDLAPAAITNAAGEEKLLQEAANLAGEDFSAPDWPYWEAIVRERDYAVDEAELRKYFPLEQVLQDGVFYAAELLYGITVTKRPDLQGYAPGVTVWEVKEADGTGIGLLLTDYFGRPSKRGGAWMSSFVDQSKLLGTLPVVVNVMGIVQPPAGAPALLSIDEVTTVFHEFGHALHGLLSDVRYPTMSGTNVPRDWVEFPSQINENWALEPQILTHYARHIETGEVIPESLIAGLNAASQWGQGFGTTEYLAASVLDLAWHSLSPGATKRLAEKAKTVGAYAVITEFEAEALSAAGLNSDTVAPRYRSTYFNHIFGGGYAAGYYSYLWSEALDADGFAWFQEVGAANSTDSEQLAKMRIAGARFRDLILAKGAASDYQQAFKDLRGRDKDVTPLLKRRGLAGSELHPSD